MEELEEFWTTRWWEEKPNQPILHQEPFLLPSPWIQPTTGCTPPPLLKQEPLSAVFVGTEPGISSASNYYSIDAAATHPNAIISSFAGFEQPPGIHPSTSHSLPIGPSGMEWMEMEMPFPNHDAISKISPGQYGMAETVFDISPQHNYLQQIAPVQNPINMQPESAMWQFEDISSSIADADIANRQPASMFYDPLSVDSSHSSSGDWSSGGEDYSSQSQDEIFEEIQRECAEIEQRQSTSPERPCTSKQAENQSKRAAAAGGTAKATMAGSSNRRTPRMERKKELNRVAATRYREKKRKEREEMVDELELLEARNRELKADIATVEAEMNYLKGLVKEIEAVRKMSKK